jgi:hypothetical protein
MSTTAIAEVNAIEEEHRTPGRRRREYPMETVGELTEEVFQRALPHLVALANDWLEREISVGRFVRVDVGDVTYITTPEDAEYLQREGGDGLARKTRPARSTALEATAAEAAHPSGGAAVQPEGDGAAELVEAPPGKGRRSGVSRKAVSGRLSVAGAQDSAPGTQDNHGRSNGEHGGNPRSVGVILGSAPGVAGPQRGDPGVGDEAGRAGARGCMAAGAASVPSGDGASASAASGILESRAVPATASRLPR